MTRARSSRRRTATFNPTGTAIAPPLSGARLWLRADLGITLNGGDVSAWADQSGTGDSNQNVVQATAARQPLYAAVDAAYNGQSTIAFTRANSDSLASGTWAAALAQPFTIFVVGQMADGFAGTFFDRLTAGAQGSQQCSIYQSWASDTFNADAGVALSKVGGLFAGTPGVFAAVFNNLSSSSYISAKTAVASGTAGTNGLDGIRLGIVFNDASDPLGGKIAEVLIYPSALSAGDRSTVFDALGSRYGITIGA